MANNNNTATFFAISTILLLLVSSFSTLPSVTTMAQQIPLTQEQLDQQNRLQNEITATTKNLAQGQKEVNGVVYTPRWSNPVWVEANSLSILFTYCLPGEFADSGQEILGGSQLEVLESYSLAVTSNLTGWLMVVENEDTQNRLPAAVGVICASDANDAQSRILSPGEQQEINNIIQQFITIQNTQVTNIENVINIINNVTNTNPPPQNETGGGGGMTPQPPANETGPTEEQLPKVKANVYPTVAFVTPDRPAEIVFDADATGGAPPYEYFWSGTYFGGGFVEDKSFRLQFTEPVDYYFRITVYDSKGYYAYEDVRVRVLRGEEESAAAQPTNDTGAVSASATEPPLMAEAIANATKAVAPATISLDANITGGAPPYSYSWSDPNLGLIDQDRSITLNFFEPGTFTYGLTVVDSRGKTVTDNVQIVISERLPQGGIVAPEPGGIAPPGEEGVPLTVEIIPNATQAVAPATFQFDSKVTGGTEPYNYRWKLLTGRFTPEYFGAQLVLAFQIPGTYTIVLNVTDSTGRAGSDSVEVTIGGLSELPPSDIGEVVPPPEGGGVLLPPETGEEGGELAGGLPRSPADDTEGEEGTPPSTTEEEPPTNDTGGG